MPQLTTADVLGFIYAIGFTICVGLFVSNSKLPRSLKRLAYVGLSLRVVGAIARYVVLYVFYDASGDAVAYYNYGLMYAGKFWRLDFSPFYDQSLWWRGTWNETGFVPFPSSVILMFIGASLIGEFVMFSLIAFLGLAGFAAVFRRVNPDVPLKNYARWIWLFPSLWFWPSSVGKESLIMMGIGVSLAGFLGKRGRIQWPLVLFGTFFIYAIRPQVAAVVIVSYMLAHWLSLSTRWTASRVMQGAAILAVGLVGIWFAMRSMGVDDFGVEGLQGYLEANQAQTTKGNSIEEVGIGIDGIPMAMVNVLSRPWPWEAKNAMSMVSSLELVFFWGIVLYRRKNFMRALRSWRSNAGLRVAIPFILLYSSSLGMLLVNLGIIARQRVFLFPFLFMLLEAVPATAKKVRRPNMRPPYSQPVRAPTQLVGGVRR